MVVLIVEDNQLQMQLISSFLQENEFEIHTATNAFDAWQKANQNIPDLILLDIMMPGMSGVELCKRFKASKKFVHIPVIFLTALGNKESVINGLHIGASDYIAKPFDKEELMARISVHMQLKKSNDIIKEQNLILTQELEKRKIAEDKFRLFYKAVDNSPLMVVITDKEGFIEYINPTVTAILGYTEEMLIGKTILTMAKECDDTLYYDSTWLSILNGKDWSGEYHNLKINGEEIWETVSVSPLKNDEDEITNLVFLIADNSESHKHIDEIQKYNDDLKELNATKDKFFSIIAHDLKNPLSVLMSSSEIMINPEFDLSVGELQQFAKEISASSKKLYELLENLLTWARSQTGRIDYNPAYNQLSDIVNYSVGVLTNNAKAKEIELILDIPQDIAVYCDVNMVTTVIRNLVSNAIKFTPNGGQISVELDKYVTSEKNNLKYVQVSVNDNGVGMSEEDSKKLFRIDEKYSTLGTNKEKGTGLGLIVSKEFIDKHEGEIWVESEVGKGTKFKFTIPAEDGEVPEIIL